MHPQRSVFFYTIGNEFFYRIKKDRNQHSSWNTLAVRIHSSPTFSDSAPHSSDSPPDILRREHIPSSRGPEAPFGSKTPLRRPFLFHTNGHPEPLPYGTDKCRASIICIIQWYSITVLCACQVQFSQSCRLSSLFSVRPPLTAGTGRSAVRRHRAPLAWHFFSGEPVRKLCCFQVFGAGSSSARPGGGV